MTPHFNLGICENGTESVGKTFSTYFILQKHVINFEIFLKVVARRRRLEIVLT